MAIVEPKKITTSKGLDIEIVSAQPEEAAKVLSHLNSIVAESEFLLITPGETIMTIDEEKKYIQKVNDSKNALFLLAKYNHEIIGLITARTFEHRKKLDHNCDLGMSVSQEFWGQGVGDAALGLLVDYYRKSKGIEKFNLEVFSSNIKARSLYKKHGFVEESLEIKKYKLSSGEYVDNIKMALWVGK